MSRLMGKKKPAPKAAPAKKPARGARAPKEAPVKKTRQAREPAAPVKAKPSRVKAVESNYLLIRSPAVTSIEGVLKEVTAGFVTIVHKNRLRPGMTQSLKRSPVKALERGVPVPGPRHFVSTIPMSKVVSIHTLEENAVVVYRDEVLVDRVLLTGEITSMEGNMLSVETATGQTIIVSADCVEIVGEVTGGAAMKSASGKPAKAAPAKKGRKAAAEDDEESDGDADDGDADGEDGEEGNEDEGDDDTGEDGAAEEGGDDDW